MTDGPGGPKFILTGEGMLSEPARPAGPDVQLVELAGISAEQLSALELDHTRPLHIRLPLYSFGKTNSLIDICNDLIEVCWIGEQIATVCGPLSVRETYDRLRYLTSADLIVPAPRAELIPVLQRCRPLYDGLDEAEPDGGACGRLLDEIEGYRDEVDGDFCSKVPELLDWYFVNLISGAYSELRSEAPDYCRAAFARSPERQAGFWKSFIEVRGARCCYASAESWLVPAHVGLDSYFEATGQKYRVADLQPGRMISMGQDSFVQTEGQTAWMPLPQYFKSRVCGGLVLMKDDDAWTTDAFDWSDAPFFRQPSNFIETEQNNLTPGTGCFVDGSGTLIVITDRNFHHVLYDTWPLDPAELKGALDDVSDVADRLAKHSGLETLPTPDWSSLSDEMFEQLCYDVLYHHPKFDAETLRKLGSSRSRDGGRDLEVFEIPSRPGAPPRRWIFQCKLVRGSGSLGGSRVQDIGDLLDRYDALGFGVMTSGLIDATLYDKADAVCARRGAAVLHFSKLEIERFLAARPALRDSYFPKAS